MDELEECGECGENVHMEYDEVLYAGHTLVGANITCPECGHTYYQGRP